MAARPIMTRDELARHKVDAHGRDYSRSDDGYSDMEVATEDGWSAIAGWARDGYDLGDWPYVVISVRRSIRRLSEGYEMRQTVEGDTTVYRFESSEDRNAAIDYLFVWYAIGREYDSFATAGLTSREGLDAGTLRVPDEFRGPFSWARCDAEKAAS